MAISTAGVDFTIPQGDAGMITDVGDRFTGIATGLEGHGITVLGTASSVSPSWTGVSASAYVDISGVIGNHFQLAAGTIRNAASTVGQWGSELDRCQQEGTLAMGQAERCLEQIQTQTTRLNAAQQAGGAAQGALTTAQANGSAARAAGPLGTVAAAVADVEATVAQAALATAKAEEQAARRALMEAEDELAHWNGRGRRAQQDAETAAGIAARILAGLTLLPPPFADPAVFSPLTETPPGSLIVHDKEGDGDKGKDDGDGDGEKKPETPIEDPNRDPKQDKKLSPGEIKKLKKGNEDPEALKGHESRADLFKDRHGNIYVKPKNGAGPGDPTGININNF